MDPTREGLAEDETPAPTPGPEEALPAYMVGDEEDLDPDRTPSWDSEWNLWSPAKGKPTFDDLPEAHSPESWDDHAAAFNEWLGGQELIMDALVTDIDCSEPPCLMAWDFSMSTAVNAEEDFAKREEFPHAAIKQLQEITDFAGWVVTRDDPRPDGRERYWAWALPNEIDPVGHLGLALAESGRERMTTAISKPMPGDAEDGEDGE